jgi:hypothetical protein
MFSKKIVTIATLSIVSALALGTVASVQAQMPSAKVMKAIDTATKVIKAFDPTAEAPIDAKTVAPSSQSEVERSASAPKKAMTWVIRDVKSSRTSSSSYPGATQPQTSVLFASDAAVGVPGVTNPYQGDTSIDQRRSLLCVSTKAGYEKPKDLETREAVTPGGATVQTWSKRRIVVVPNVLGSDLTSDKVANKKCSAAGQLTLNDPNFRMAEFHDGIGQSPGWSFWTEGYSVRDGLDAQPQNPNIKGSSEARYWVCINDQPANPWPGASCKPQ